VSVTVYVPVAAYVCVGFCTVEVLPSPKSHAQEEAFAEVSVNWAGCPAHTGALDVKDDVGVEPVTVTAWPNGALAPHAFVATRVTV
jgi:hypothetical protein